MTGKDMTSKKTIPNWLIILGFIVIWVFIAIFPVSAILLFILTLLYKLIPNGTTYTLAIGLPFIWGPILGAIVGIPIGIKMALSIIKIRQVKQEKTATKNS